MKKNAKPLLFLLLVALGLSALAYTVSAAEIIPIPSIDITVGTADTPEEINRSLQILFFMTLVGLSPFLLVMLTSFVRLIVSFHFMRAAMGTQQMPPNQVLVGLALFLTLFLMGPTLTRINEEALGPFNSGEITQGEAFTSAMRPIRDFMWRQVEIRDLELFSDLAQLEPYDTEEQMFEELPSSVLIPAFILGELTKGFKIGVILYIPFIVIDMVVASTLMAMGMMMLPPAMISLPFKIMFFVMADGWNLVIRGILLTFN